ncbi:hypothetical protein ACLMAJ_03060 [Nocardia sp. KC 131]|uniref:hypothetical protein n=1 Tax=Nocardia arseniciresistens TaxID=3392119 RepID=UPI00398E5699
MVQPTPWQAGDNNPQGQAEPPNPTSRGAPRRQIDVAKVIATLRPHLASLQGSWGYVFAAVGSIITFITLFQPWINAVARDGRIKANPFGRLQISSSLVTLWSGSPPPQVKINGTWAVLATIAITITIFATVVNLRARTEALRHLVAGTSVATALFVVFAMVHLNNKGPALRDMLGYGNPRDLGGQIGLLMRWASGNGQYPVPGLTKVSITTASLTAWAWFAAVMAVASAVAAVAQWIRNQPAGSVHLPMRISVVTSPRAANPAPAPTPDPPPATP